MRRFFTLLLTCTLLPLLTGGQPAARAADPVYDVVVYGGTSAGVAAAIQTARMGKSCVIVEPGRHLGGLTTGGLGWTDSGSKSAIGGTSREFYQRIKKHYDNPQSWVYVERDKYSR